MVYVPDIARPTWDELHMIAALLPATRTSCLVRGVGAALVKNNKVIASSYNGAPSGVTTCLELDYCYYQDLAWQHVAKEGGEFKEQKERYKPFCIASHAEANVMNQCAEMGISPAGGTLFVSTFPCFRCTRDEIVGKGIKELVIWKPYLSGETEVTDERLEAEKLLKQKDILFRFVDLPTGRIVEITTLMQSVGGRTAYVSKPRDYNTL